MRRLYFDLDGTLIDVQERHYAAYVDAARELGYTPLNKDAFWARRRDGAELQDLVAELDAADSQRFEERWQELANAPSYVRLDALIPGSRATLATLRDAYELVLITLRQDREALLEQINEFGLDGYFTRFCSLDCDDVPPSMAALIDLLADRSGGDEAIVGDAEDDIEAARALGLDAFLISRGMRSRRYLEMWEPDELLSSLQALRQLLRNGGTQPANE